MSQLKTFYKKLTSIQKRATTVGIDFNLISKEAVEIVWNPEIGDISAVNKCLDVARTVKGFNDQALLKYFKQCVPFTYNTEQMYFTKKNGQTVDRMETMWEEFILSNDWYDYIPEKVETPYAFKPESIVTQLEKKLGEAGEHDALTIGNLLALQADLNAVIDASMPMQDTATVDNAYDEEELKALLIDTPLQAVG